jgi:hypothetical protein
MVLPLRAADDEGLAIDGFVTGFGALPAARPASDPLLLLLDFSGRTTTGSESPPGPYRVLVM